jgi:predicted RNA binding protein with dsRBD fold (UPF0201 family)
MKIEIFRGRVNVNQDFNDVEGKVRAFIATKNVIEIKQSLAPYGTDGQCLLVLTVLYE